MQTIDPDALELVIMNTIDEFVKKPTMKKRILFFSLLLFVSFPLLSEAGLFSILYRGDLAAFQSVKTRINNFNQNNGAGESALIVLLNGFLNYKRTTAGSTPLHVAASKNDVNMVKLLLENGALISVWDSDGKTPLQVALDAGAYETVKLLREQPYIVYTREKEYVDLAAELVGAGADVNTFALDGESALNMAVRSGSLTLVKLLVENGADISYQASTNSPNALLRAVSLGRYDICEFLLQHGARSRTVLREGNVSSNQNENGESYLLPDAYNLKVLIESDVSDPAGDRRCYYKIYIDKVEVGRTTTGLESQKKEYTATLESNRHLLTVVKYVLDKEQNKYVKLNNIYQPRPTFFYFPIIENRITLLEINHITEGTSQYSSSFVRRQDGL